MAPVDRADPSYKLRHSTAHVMAQAVGETFPKTKFAWGPPHDRFANGFYYDFDLPRALTPEDLPEIEARMRRIIRGNHPFRCRVVGADEARELFADQPYKLETIDDLSEGKDEYGETRSGGTISTYTQDTFEDLCLGPHVEHTGQIPVDGFKLLDVSGAYWRGSVENKMLQRVYGTVWPGKEDLDRYLWRREEEERRDHRRLGSDLDLFSFRPEVGSGLALLHPKGALVRTIMEDYWRERHRAGGYDFVATPHIGRSTLWGTSGHLKWYEEGMYSSIDIDDEQYYLKPMNCPFHMLIFKSRVRSYRDLPMRFAELGTVYRYEPSGTLRGLLRVRGFTQDDAHLFCRPDQMEAEIHRALEFCLSILAAYGFETPEMELSVRDPRTPEKYAGSEADWEVAESTLAAALDSHGLPYERMEGEAVFYGPKIDMKILDALGRRWQASTIQFDFNLPERFDLTYVGEDNRPHRPYMVHRALYGSIERFLALLIEHYSGALPVWLAPTQAMVIPVSNRNLDYARNVGDALASAGFRVEVDESTGRMNAKIRDAQLQKIPYMLIVGNREERAGGSACGYALTRIGVWSPYPSSWIVCARLSGRRAGCKGATKRRDDGRGTGTRSSSACGVGSPPSPRGVGDEHRRKLLEGLAGRVIEVGAGNGANFPYYPASVERVFAAEPEEHLRRQAERAATSAPVPITVLDGLADELPGEDGAFDAGVVALVLCTVPEQGRAIRPGGELRFYEHVLSHEPLPARLQRLADATFWPRLFGGCHTARDTGSEIRRAGFEIENHERFTFGHVPLSPPLPHIIGAARLKRRGASACCTAYNVRRIGEKRPEAIETRCPTQPVHLVKSPGTVVAGRWSSAPASYPPRTKYRLR